jgi:hypothetical protein
LAGALGCGDDPVDGSSILFPEPTNVFPPEWSGVWRVAWSARECPDGQLLYSGEYTDRICPRQEATFFWDGRVFVCQGEITTESVNVACQGPVETDDGPAELTATITGARDGDEAELQVDLLVARDGEVVFCGDQRMEMHRTGFVDAGVCAGRSRGSVLRGAAARPGDSDGNPVTIGPAVP